MRRRAYRKCYRLDQGWRTADWWCDRGWAQAVGDLQHYAIVERYLARKRDRRGHTTRYWVPEWLHEAWQYAHGWPVQGGWGQYQERRRPHDLTGLEQAVLVHRVWLGHWLRGESNDVTYDAVEAAAALARENAERAGGDPEEAARTAVCDLLLADTRVLAEAREYVARGLAAADAAVRGVRLL